MPANSGKYRIIVEFSAGKRFHGGNTGSNPVGDARFFSNLETPFFPDPELLTLRIM
jgi:hypothetical protein